MNKLRGQPIMANPLNLLEATGGFEPPDKGFADLCLTTWLRRLTDFPRDDRREIVLIPFPERPVKRKRIQIRISPYA